MREGGLAPAMAVSLNNILESLSGGALSFALGYRSRRVKLENLIVKKGRTLDCHRASQEF